MTEEVLNEEQPNPYNLKKSWHTGEDKPFESADQLYFEEPSEKNKLFKSGDVNEAEQVGNVEVDNLETKDSPYKKPDYKKRYDDLKRHHDKTVNSLRAKNQELLEEASANKTEYTAPKTEEELEDFKNSYPEVYEVVETVAHMQSESKAKLLEERLSKLQQRETEIVQQEAIKRLQEKHPDFQEIKNSESFHDWANEQPQSIRDWIYNNPDDADLATRALDLFKNDMGIGVPEKKKSSSKKTKSAADMVSTKTTSVEPKSEKIWSEKEIAAMSMAEFDKHEVEISEAMQQGRIIK
jgi:hypothetical protein|tara:strand:+ start:371 stop:1255 length:885 start_codon:yes stop_codon:yes gene_type:complete